MRGARGARGFAPGRRRARQSAPHCWPSEGAGWKPCGPSRSQGTERRSCPALLAQLRPGAPAAPGAPGPPSEAGTRFSPARSVAKSGAIPPQEQGRSSRPNALRARSLPGLAVPSLQPRLVCPPDLPLTFLTVVGEGALRTRIYRGGPDPLRYKRKSRSLLLA